MGLVSYAKKPKPDSYGIENNEYNENWLFEVSQYLMYILNDLRRNGFVGLHGGAESKSRSIYRHLTATALRGVFSALVMRCLEVR